MGWHLQIHSDPSPACCVPETEMYSLVDLLPSGLCLGLANGSAGRNQRVGGQGRWGTQCPLFCLAAVLSFCVLGVSTLPTPALCLQARAGRGAPLLLAPSATLFLECPCTQGTALSIIKISSNYPSANVPSVPCQDPDWYGLGHLRTGRPSLTWVLMGSSAPWTKLEQVFIVPSPTDHVDDRFSSLS